MASKEFEFLDSDASIEKPGKIAAGRALNRRHFLSALGLTGAAAGAGLLSGCSTSNSLVTSTPGTVQTDVLSFILNIKYLEATFYAYVTTGGDLPATSTANSGAVTGGPAKLTFAGQTPQQTTDLLNEIYFDERNHVSTLITLLGSAGIARPAINLSAFGAITATNALSIARLMEDVGATALAGAATLLSSSDLTLISQMLGAESFHAGALRLISIQNPTIAAYVKADSFDVAPVDPGSAALAAAGPAASGGFFATAGATTSSAANPAGMSFARTSSQTMAVLYGSGAAPATSGTASGGFFPSGLNGRIKTV